MNAQLRELLTRIPASPETDELQSLLEAMSKERRIARNRALRILNNALDPNMNLLEAIQNIPE